jgi:6-phosphogluconolactonase
MPTIPSAPRPHLEILAFTSAEILARAVAAALVDQATRARDEGRRLSVALSGGRIPKLFLAEAAQASPAAGGCFGTSHFFWSDERCVAPDSPDSNYDLARRAFLEPARIGSDQIHRLEGELEPRIAAERAGADLRRRCDLNAGGVPALDVVFLGMGEDGHVASIFPGAPELLWTTDELVVPATGPKPPPQRLTMTPRLLAAAKEVWVVASGAEKGAAWRESLRADGNTPLSRLLRLRAHTRLWTEAGLF